MHVLSFPAGVSYLFDTNGTLQSISDEWGSGVSLIYSNQLLSCAEHSNGSTLNFAYSNGMLTSVIAATNLSISFKYAPEGVLTQAVRQVDSDQYLEAYAYDTSLLLTQRVDAVGNDYYYSYSGGKASGMYLTDDHLYGHSVSYDSSNNQSVVTYENSSNSFAHVYTIDPNSSRVQEEWFDAVTGKVTFVYDGGKNVQQKTTYDADTNNWIKIYRFYDEFHNVTEEAFGLSAEPDHVTETTWHSDWQLVTSVVDPEGFKTEYEYTNGMPSAERLYLSGNETAETRYSYTTNGLLAAVTNANGHSTIFAYDALGYPQTVVPQTGPTITLGYDTLGHLTNSALPGGRETDYTVTPLGWIERVDYADSLYETFDYNALGKVTNHVDRAGRISSYTYAPNGKLTAISRQLGNTNVTVSYDFDQQFNTLNIRDELSRPVESYVLDPLARPTTVTNVENQTMSIRYLVGDFVDSITRFDGTIVSNEYTGDGRLAAVYYPDETNRYTYLKNGLVQTLENSAVMVSNDWNSASWLTSVSSSSSVFSVSSVANYSYDPVGNVTNSSVDFGGPRSITTAYEYDAAERVTLISTPPTNCMFQYFYNPDNGLISTVSNASLRAEYQCDIMDRITSIDWRNSGGASILSFNYQYNAAGMITNRLVGGSSSISTAYQYDDLDRLTSEVRTAGVSPAKFAMYSYDLAGNRLTKQNPGSSVNYSLGAGNRLASWTATSTNGFESFRTLEVQGYSSETIGTDNRWGQLTVSNSVAVTPETDSTNFWLDAFVTGMGTQRVVAAIRDQAGNMGYATNEIFLTVVTNAQYGYSAAGCLTNVSYFGTEYAESLSLDWNSQYQLTSISSATSAVEYSYDVLGRRASRTEGTNVEQYVYDGNQIVADLDESGTILRSYIWGPGIDNLLAITIYNATGTNTCYALKDHLNTVCALIDSFGNIVESYSYDAWGCPTILNSTGTELTESAIGNRYMFQGREHDSATGLYYFRARWYDPVTGRWLSKDPIGISGGLNQYVFCGNNPVNFVDPMGLYWFRQPWQESGVVGRPDTIVPPRGPISEFIERYLPAGYTFGQMHDSFVGWATMAGFPDWRVNKPSMYPMYWAAVAVEMLRAFEKLPQPSPPEEATPCK
ncbi:MAG: RHS repeat-associated core domain-containing protein [Verrucomicrobia bacterium]|nr:RHS repeat-associated core domain-containing protein [Verrucomicrobiota bacterium]